MEYYLNWGAEKSQNESGIVLYDLFLRRNHLSDHFTFFFENMKDKYDSFTSVRHVKSFAQSF